MNGGKATKAPAELPYFALDTRRGRANSCLFIFFCFVRKVIRWICVGYVATWKRHENFINCLQIHNSNPWFLVGSICKRICLNKQVNFTYSTRTFDARHECQGWVSDKWRDFETDECQLKRHLLTLVGAVCAWSNKVKFAGGNDSIFSIVIPFILKFLVIHSVVIKTRNLFIKKNFTSVAKMLRHIMLLYFDIFLLCRFFLLLE